MMRPAKDLMSQKVRDKHTGLTGVATAYSVFENGCVRWGVELLDKDGVEVKDVWFDEQRLELVGQPVPTAKDSPRTGGPRSHNPRRSDPAR